MAAVETPAPVTLIPPRAQTLWGPLAVANFALGGLGAGFYVVAAAAARFGASPALALASWLGPALVLAGLGAVAIEAGRPFRGWRVLTRVHASWMSREAWLGGAFAFLAAADVALRLPGQRLAAAAAGVGLALAQGFILREARGIAAWAVPVMPPLFLASALVSGVGLLVLVQVAGGPPSPPLLGSVLVVLTADVLVWSIFVTWSGEDAFLHGVRPLREGHATLVIVGSGYLAPSLLTALAVALPEAARPLAAAGAALAIGGQVYAKAALILKAGQTRATTLPHLRLGRRTR